MKTYTATFNGVTVQRKSERDYVAGVVAVFPNGAVKMISCHATHAQAAHAATLTDGQCARFSAFKKGATFHAVPLVQA